PGETREKILGALFVCLTADERWIQSRRAGHTKLRGCHHGNGSTSTYAGWVARYRRRNQWRSGASLLSGAEQSNELHHRHASVAIFKGGASYRLCGIALGELIAKSCRRIASDALQDASV